MSQSIAKIPKGVRYFFGAEVTRRRAIEQRVLSVFTGWSYHEIVLPIFDYHRLFALGMGSEAAEHTYRFIDPDGELLALRPDLTSLVARTVATRFAGQARPIRLCYSGEVFRYKEAQEERPHDFHQFGLEHIGNDRLEADVEVLLVAIEALSALGLRDFKITLGHANFFNGIVKHLQFDLGEIERFRQLIDQKNIFAVQQFLQSHCQPELAASVVDYCQLLRLTEPAAVLAQARALVMNQLIAAAVDDLTGIIEIASALGIDRYLMLDLGEVHGLDYYTGMIFKIYGAGAGAAIGSGGRYDGLLENFGCAEPAVGFQLSLDWLARLASDWPTAPAPAARLLASQDLVTLFQQAQRLRADQQRIEITALLPE